MADNAPALPDVQLAKDALAELLTRLNVRRVVFVDDSFEITDNADAAIGWFDEALSLSYDVTASLLRSVNFSVPERGWAEEFRAEWLALGHDQRNEVVKGLSAILGRLVGQDLDFAADLKSIFPRRFRPTELGPSAWEEQQDEILREASPTARVLCFFDQDLSQAEGFTAQGTRSGVGLLKDTLDRYAEDAIVCGVLSHTFTAELELTAWRQFAEEHGLELRRFLPISKSRLKDPSSFVVAVKKTTLNLYCEQLKAGAVEVLTLTHQSAAEELEAIDVYDFDDVILRSSLKEGVSEIDTLIRIYHIFHQDRVKRAFLNPERASVFHSVIEDARELSRIGERLHANRPDHRWDLRHREMFEDRELVNAFHAPLQSGDLFSLGEQAHPAFILIGQPCDLMVRSDGQRGDYGADRSVDLIPITRMSEEQFRGKTFNSAVRSALHYLYSGTNDVGIVEYAAAHIVRLDVLDLAVLNSDGKCYLDLKTVQADAPPQFHKAWRMRRDLLVQLYQDRAQTIERLLPAINAVEDEGIRSALLVSAVPPPTLGKLQLTVPAYQNSTFNYGIRRVGRLREPWAINLLSSYMRYRGRPAEQHDFVIVK